MPDKLSIRTNNNDVERHAVGAGNTSENSESGKSQSIQIKIPQITLPKGGGALKGIDEKFQVNAANGTASFSIPLPISPGRSGFSPQLNLSYNSGSGNSAFGLGWSVDYMSIQRKTDKQLPRYRDALEEDVFMLSGMEDLVPYLIKQGEDWIVKEFNCGQYRMKNYRPRIEGGFLRIEKVTHSAHGIYWRVTTKDNITTIFGRDKQCRITDPEDETKIFNWLPEFSYDNKGNWISFEYKEDTNVDSVARDKIPNHLNEKNRRNGYDLFTNRYLKYVKYGNRIHYNADPALPFDPQPPENNEQFFTLVFDYGEHDTNQPTINETEGQDWNYREDAFSDYRSGFEIRTARLCKRILMFHQFEKLGASPCLVKSLDLNYVPSSINQSGQSEVTYLQSIIQTSYKLKADGSYAKKSIPPLEFSYQQLQWSDEVRVVSEEDIANVPAGMMSPYQWVDFYGEGISGIFTEQGGEWFYKRNSGDVDEDGNVQFTPTQIVAPRPSFSGVSTGVLQLQDLESNGEKQIVINHQGLQGYFELSDDEQWESYIPFENTANIDLQDPNLRMIDMNGDGKPELVISEENVFVWFASAGKKGYKSAEFASKVFDEEKGPAIVFADSLQTIYLADINGDGLTDIVRIRNGEVCYWANKGYGCFSAKIGMNNAPTFDHPDQFNPEYIHFADVSGTGTSDILYLGKSSCNVFLNLSGNSWSDAQPIETFPAVEKKSQVAVVDLLGTGTPCLVWSTDLPANGRAPMRYIDLMSSRKPHVLIKYINNLGKETSIEYKTSTWFYLKDKLACKPWITKLSFPVQVVHQTTVEDKYTKTKFSAEYSYHHGYYDHIEREFRGFGRVEQTDVQDYGTFIAGNTNSPYITPDKKLFQPPVKTITWFHTGAFLDRKNILLQFEKEYFAPSSDKFHENLLPQPDLNALNLSAEEWREALRSCKGMTLRQEVYELDVDALELNGRQIPVRLFNTSFQNCTVQLLQPQNNNRYAVFYAAESEAITYNYELDLRLPYLHPDPRIAHTFNLKTDKYGNLLQSVAAVYPRVERYTDASLPGGTENLIETVQKEPHLVYTENRFTNTINDIDESGVTNIGDNDFENISKLIYFRLPLPCEVSTYELTGIKPADENFYFSIDDFCHYQLSGYYINDITAGSTDMAVQEIPYHIIADNTKLQKRLVEQARTLYFDEDLVNPLDFGVVNYLGLPYENYKLALTEDLINAILQDKLSELLQAGENYDALLQDVLTEGGYHFLDNAWWIRSGIAGFAEDAATHFYLPERYTDPFGNITTLTFDPYDLFIQSSIDPVENRTEVTQFDFRLLAPKEIKDLNNNLSEIAFDILGHPAAIALKGKGDEGDNLDDYAEDFIDLPLNDIINFFTSNYDESAAQRLLGNATARNLYYFGEQLQPDGSITSGNHPAGAATIQREKHLAQLQTGETSLLQVNFAYSNGSDGVLVTKTQAEPENGSENLRWIARGKTVLNNKGKAVKQYEPYFTDSHRFEEPAEIGVTPIMYYDAAGRLIRTEMPDGSYSRIEFTSWHVATYDQNDTVLEDGNAWYAERMKPDAAEEDKRAAIQAAVHADTPAITFLDSLGRNVISIAHNKYEDSDRAIHGEKYVTFTKLDAEGKPLWIRDARGNLVMQYVKREVPPPPQSIDAAEPVIYTPAYDIAGNLLFQHSMDAGDRWMLPDSTGQPMYGWDSKGNLFHFTCDKLCRPQIQSLQNATHTTAIAINYTQYGENHHDAIVNNLRGKAFRSFDQSGMITSMLYDFEGNLLEVRRRLVAAYQQDVDWTSITDLSYNIEPDALLMPEAFIQTTEYDALNRMTRQENWHLEERQPAIYEPQYNRRGVLSGEHLTVQGQRQEAIVAITYDAKGQKQSIRYGNGTLTRYYYDTQTFRLLQLRTTRRDYEQPFPGYKSNLRDENVLQQLYYTYDPVGNITEIYDDAYKPVFFRNQIVLPQNQYRYDALYRLIQATGRENYSAVSAPGQFEERPFTVSFPADTNALRNYTQNYKYDGVGNILEMSHTADGAFSVSGSWTRHYTYEDYNNRLHQTWIGNDTLSAISYNYDPHGSMLNLINVAADNYLQWDYRDMICSLNLQGGGWVYYTYDAQKQRTRKLLNKGGGLIEERLYLGGMELYRRYQNNVIFEEIETYHLFEGSNKVLLVENVLITNNANLSVGALFKYQYSNHLGSVGLELDEEGNIISYEEYHPYGTTAYRAGRNAAEVSLKRYRYTGMERDEESGLNYHGARYYATWLGRWVSSDPANLKDGINLYSYVRNNFINAVDPLGTQSLFVRTDTVVHHTRANLPSIDRAGLRPGNPNGWLGAGPYFNSASTPFATMQNSPVAGGFTLQTRIDARGFYLMDFSLFRLIERRINNQHRGRQNARALREAARGRYFDTLMGRSNLPGIIVDIPEGIPNTPSGRLYVVRDMARVRPDYTIRGMVTGGRGNFNIAPTIPLGFNFTGHLASPIPTPPVSVSFGLNPPANNPQSPPIAPPNLPNDTAIPSPQSNVTPPAVALEEAAGSGGVLRPAAQAIRRGANAVAEATPSVLRGLGYIATLTGAYNEAMQVRGMFDNSLRGTILGGLNATGTLVLGVAAGVVDDLLGAATIEMGSVPLISSWEAHGSGPAQHAVGRFVRWLVTQ